MRLPIKKQTLERLGAWLVYTVALGAVLAIVAGGLILAALALGATP